MTYKYRNTTEMELTVPGVGVVPPKAEVEIDHILENPNFEAIGNNAGNTDAHSPTLPNSAHNASSEAKLPKDG